MSVPGTLVRTFVLRDLLFNKVRTILTVLGIALGVAVMLAINLANNTALSRFQESIDLVAGKTNLEVVARSGPELDENVLLNLNFLRSQFVLLTPVIDALAVVPGDKPDVVQVLGVDMFADPAFRPFAISGKGGGGKALFGADIFNANSAYVGEKFAAKYNLQKGSSFKLLVNDAEKVVNVVDVLAYSGSGKAFGGNVLVMDIGPAQALFDMPGRISRVDIMLPVDASSQTNSPSPEVQKQFVSRIKNALPVDATVQLPSRRSAQVQKMLAAFQYNLAALSLIALLVGMFLIYNTMSMTVIRKRSEIGILRAIGISRSSVFGVFLIQALMLGATGSLLGLGLGLLFAGGAVSAVGRTVKALYVDQPSAEIAVSGTTLLIAFFAGMLLTALAALGPIFEAMSVPPAEASRRASYELRISRGSGKLAIFGCLLLLVAWLAAMAPAVNGFPMFGYMAAALSIFGVAFCMPVILSRLVTVFRPLMYALFGSEGKLAVLSLGGTLGRTSVTVASLMLGIAMMVSLAVMIGSFRETVIVWVKQSLQADLYVEPAARAASSRVGKLSQEVVKRIRELPGVQDVDSFVEFPIEYNGAITNLGAGDLDVLAKHGRLIFVDRENPEAVFDRLLGSGNKASVGGNVASGTQSPAGEPTHACVVSESFALRNNVHKGDTITLSSHRGDFLVKVESIYFDYASDLGYVILPRPLFRKYFDDTYSTTLGVYLDPGADIERVRSQMVSQLGATTRLNVRTNRELREEVLRVFDNTFSITYALHAISILVAILGVMNALFALTFEMRRDFAILKYIGASTQQIRKIILLQATTLGLFGTTSGMIVGLVLSLLLINVINKQSFGWTIQLAIPFGFLAQSFGLIMLFSFLSGILPAHAATKNITPEAVRVE